MTRDEFIERTKHYHGRVGDLEIVLDNYTMAEFVLGCYYDKETNTWKVYENGERGMRGVNLETASEELALDELYSTIEFENKMDLRYRAQDAKRKKQV